MTTGPYVNATFFKCTAPEQCAAGYLKLNRVSFDKGNTWVGTRGRLRVRMLPPLRVPRIVKMFPSFAMEGIPQEIRITGGPFDSVIDGKTVAICDFSRANPNGVYSHWKVPICFPFQRSR